LSLLVDWISDVFGDFMLKKTCLQEWQQLLLSSPGGWPGNDQNLYQNRFSRIAMVASCTKARKSGHNIPIEQGDDVATESRQRTAPPARPLVTAQLTAILQLGFSPVSSMRRNHFNTVLPEYINRLVTVIRAVTDQILRPGIDHAEVKALLHQGDLMSTHPAMRDSGYSVILR
jgi:hypothetical protein